MDGSEHKHNIVLVGWYTLAAKFRDNEFVVPAIRPNRARRQLLLGGVRVASLVLTTEACDPAGALADRMVAAFRMLRRLKSVHRVPLYGFLWLCGVMNGWGKFPVTQTEAG